MGRFLVGIAQYGQNLHVQAFWEHVKSMASALRDLGHDVEWASADAMKKGGRLIIWGANALSEDPKASAARGETIPAGSIIFQSEQISAVDTPDWFLQKWLNNPKYTVWDYAQSNVDEMHKLGVARPVLCPLGYHPSMSMIKPAEQDIDVLFYGSRGGPRREILNALDVSGLNVVQIFGKYGEERDSFIARAKVVINLHYYPRGVFEIFRCSHLFANRVCVVNEAGGRDTQLEELAKRCTAYTPREEIIDRCRELVASPHRRAMIAEQGFEEFKKLSLVDNVKSALEVS